MRTLTNTSAEAIQPRICAQPRINAGKCTPISFDDFCALIDDPRLQDICDQIKLLDGTNPDEKSRLKHELPIITPHACAFRDDQRRNDGAQPNGLVMLDIDAFDDPDRWWADLDRTLLTTHRILVVHKTPSGHGLRLIAERLRTTNPDGTTALESIPDAQLRLTEAFAFLAYDTCTKDLARASYVVPRSYFYHLDPSAFQWTPENYVDAPSNHIKPHQTTSNEGQRLYTYDLPLLRDVRDILVSRAGGVPAMGMRNDFLLGLTMKMRYITDFNADILAQVLDPYGLPDTEFRQVIHNGIARPRHSEIPQEVRLALDLATQSQSLADINPDDDPLNPSNPLNSLNPSTPSNPSSPSMRLPPVITRILAHYPEEFHAPMLTALMPILGTLLTSVRFDYLDGATQSFSFLSCITAGAANNKSFVRRAMELLLTPIRELDDIERDKEEQYRAELRAARNRREQPVDPKAVCRIGGVSISIAKLLQQMSYAEGKHLFGFSAELDTLLKTERAGVWSQKSDIYRLAFHNEYYSQSYMNTENTFSANIPVFYNLLLTGTPGSLYRFFRDVEDGLVTRWCFSQIPDNFGQQMPHFIPFSQREEEQIIANARWMMQQGGRIEVPSQIRDAIARWLEQKRIEAITRDSRTLDTLRRRTALIGYRAGVLMFTLFRCTQRQACADFAVWFAEYCFQQQYALFGEQFDAIYCEQEAKALNRRASRDILEFLPPQFTLPELARQRIALGKSGNITAIRTFLSRLIASGKVERLSDGQYKKT